MRLQWIAAAVLLAWPCAAQEPEIRQFDIPTLQKLGYDMYVQDQAAWHATDALLAEHTEADLQKEKIRGWIVENVPGGQLVRFMREGSDGLEAAYDVSNSSGKPVVAAPGDRHLTDVEKAMFSARTLAGESLKQGCSDTANTVVLKDPEGPGWLAWGLAATHDPTLIMAGGHHRLTISPDGTKVLRMDALSRTCNVMKKAEPPPGSQVAALFTTQLVSMVPVETFVFLSLQHRMPIFVGTPDKVIWRVDGDRISQIDTSRRDVK